MLQKQVIACVIHLCKKKIFRFLFLTLLHIVEIVFIILAWFLEDTCNTQYTVIHFCWCFGGQIKTESVNSEEHSH